MIPVKRMRKTNIKKIQLRNRTVPKQTVMINTQQLNSDKKLSTLSKTINRSHHMGWLFQERERQTSNFTCPLQQSRQSYLQDISIGLWRIFDQKK